MSKLINLIHPYEIENINTVSDFLLLLKNILRLSTKRIIEKKDGILIPVRWSGKKNNWVVDRGTDLQRDIVGIDKTNINLFYKKQDHIYNGILFTLELFNNNNLEELFQKLNLKKNENKFFAFEYCNNNTNIIDNRSEFVYPIGLFQRCQTKKRSGVYSKKYKSILIDNCEETLNKVSNCCKDIEFINSYRLKNYYENYNKFYKEIKSKSYEFKLKDFKEKVTVSEILSKNINKNLLQKDILKFIDNSLMFNKLEFNKIKSNVILYLVYFDFVKFIKKILNIKNNDIEGFVVVDEKNNIYYKITGEFILKVYKKNNVKKEQVLFSPILPGVF